MLLGYLLLFFYRRPPAAGQANTICRSSPQLVVEFLPTTTNGIDMHPCDLGHQGRTTVSQLLGLQGHIPTALLLIQTTEQQVRLMVQLLVWVVTRLLATWTLALMYRLC
jgi:hypothetical protein